MTPEDEAILRNELQLLDTLNLGLQQENAELRHTVSGLSRAVASLSNDVSFQAKAMLEIARIVGMPVEDYNMSKLADYIKERWGAASKSL